LGAIGLEVLLRREVHPDWRFAIPSILLAVLCGWCIYRCVNLPEPISQLEETVRETPIRDIDEPWEAVEIQNNFRKTYAVDAVFCGAGVAFWCFLMLGSATAGWFVPALTALLCIQLVYFGYGFAAQTNPELYFPKIPILERIASGPPGRVIGFNCLPANLAQMARLKDVRGYDGVDPMAMIQILNTARDPRWGREVPYARTQYMSPVIYKDQTGEPRLPPVLDMLSVRYVIFRGTPPPDANPTFVDTDYWVWVNERAMPRAFVPRRVQVITSGPVRLNAMNSADFDPREIAYVEQPLELSQEGAGTVEIVSDEHQRVILRAQMETAGLVVLADRWDSGWRAYVNDIEVPILRVNHALRGVVVGPGTSTIRFVYLPAKFFIGFIFTAAGGICILAWMAAAIFWRRRTSSKSGS
jgi:hypothetical protein